jgi:sporulation protein YlmC with PRC-barrel domain
VAVAKGKSVIVDVNEPELQVYVVAPEAVSVIAEPAQTVELPAMVIVGLGEIVIVVETGALVKHKQNAPV